VKINLYIHACKMKNEPLSPSFWKFILPYEFVRTSYRWARIVQSVYQEDTGWAARVQFPAGAKEFSLLQKCPNQLQDPPSILSNGNRGRFAHG
jgi:hypothetical protein